MHALIFSCILPLVLCFCRADPTSPDTVIIDTKYGKVEGDVIKAEENGFAVAAFKGIPFGSAKFLQKPEPMTPWNGTLKARGWGARCYQHQLFGIMEPMMSKDVSEDCLHLNVFAPYEKNTSHAVLVFIHGGGFGIGASSQYPQEGIVNWLVPKGVVIVTVNYRLGPWGFFTTGNSDALGNYGLWDQALALQWVKDNIDRFGGDPQKVTIFGESAGAASVSLLALSPHSRDLFQQSIVMSGSSYLHWMAPIDGNSLEASHILSTALGCGPLMDTNNTTINTKTVLECVKSKTSEEILNALHIYKPFGKFEYIGFAPVHDQDFFPDTIDKLQSTAPPKPMISGTTAAEMGSWITSSLFTKEGWHLENPESFTFEQFNEKLQYFFPEKVYHQSTPLIRDLAANHYIESMGDRNNNTFVVEQYIQLFSDFEFVYPAYKEAVLRQQKGSKVWLYSFDYYDDALFAKDFKFKGAHHYFEMPYLFRMSQFEHPSPFEGNDKKIKDIMTTLWTNFAIYGHPKPTDKKFLDDTDFTWEPLTDQNPSRFLHIGLQPEQKELYRRRMVSFWHELLPKVINFGGVIKDAQVNGNRTVI